MRRIVIFGLTGSKIFATLSHKRQDFREIYWSQNVCFSCSPKLLCETFLILRRIQRYAIINILRSSCEARFILVVFWWKLNFLGILSKNIQIRNFTKILPVEAEVFHADGRTGMMKLIIAFHNFAKAPKERLWLEVTWWDMKQSVCHVLLQF